VAGAPIGFSVETDGLGEGDGDGLGVGVAGVTGLAVVVGRIVTVAVPDPGALAVKKVEDADAPAPGVPPVVQAETASAANATLQRAAANRARTLVRPTTQRNRMKPPDVTAAVRLFPRSGLNKPAFEEETAGPA
jgi:hypothetical protein